MTSSFEPDAAALGSESTMPAARIPARATALAAGLIVLAVGLLVSIGTVLLAPIGMWIVARVQRRRGRTLSPEGNWLAAVGSIAIVFVLLATSVVALTPADFWRQAARSADSTAAVSARTPPPAWLERIAPGASRQPANAPPTSPRMQQAAVAWGIGLAALILSAIYGTLGWGASLLLAFALTGRWLGWPTRPAPDVVAAR